MPTKYHMRMSVRGALRNRSFDGLEHDDGRPMSRAEACDTLLELLKQGKEYIPVGDCDNWDGERCQGHPVEKE